MKKNVLFTILLTLVTVIITALPLPSLGSTELVSSLSPMLKKVMPAVVNLSAQGEVPLSANPFIDKNNPETNPGAGSKFQHTGSGVIVDAKRGYILTNAHVIFDAQIITVILSDGRHLLGKKIGADNASDLAVIQVKADNLTEIPFAESDEVNVGDFVAAIGSPYGLQQTVTSGVVSALNRQIGIEGVENFIQTDASINPGNSGGALVNVKGQLIGINTAILAPGGSSIGIGFAIPSTMANGVMQQLIEYGKIDRGLLGVMVQDLTPALAAAFHMESLIGGSLVTDVLPDSPAAKAGIQGEDVIEKINQKPIKNAAQIHSLVGTLRVNSELALEIRRGKNTLKLNVVIADPARQQENMLLNQTLLAGMRMRNFDQLGGDAHHLQGVQVLTVPETSHGWFNGVRPGDVILMINNTKTINIDKLLEVTKNNPKQLLLKIGRDSGIIYLVIT